jgi:hypothetical protein
MLALLARLRRGACATFVPCRFSARIIPIHAIISGPSRRATSVCFLEQSGQSVVMDPVAVQREWC